MPELALLRLQLSGEVLEFTNLVLELYYESDFGRCAEVADDEEADHFQKAFSRQALLVSSHERQVFEL